MFFDGNNNEQRRTAKLTLFAFCKSNLVYIKLLRELEYFQIPQFIIDSQTHFDLG